jgi:GTPase SAR1 family protein
MTDGEEINSQPRISYLRGASGALVVCDLTRRETFTIFERYARQMRLLNPQTSLVMVGNKVDLLVNRAVADRDIQAVCSTVGIETFFLSSAKTGENVEAAFLHLAGLLEAHSS